MKVLQLTPHFFPNMGGVETHLNDLVVSLNKRNYEVFVLTYRPLTTKTNWKIFEGKNNLKILRIPWIPFLFYKLVNKPILEFLYLAPGLFIYTPFVILLFRPKIIHSHGIVAGFVATFWSKIFNVRSIISLHSIYHFPQIGLYRSFVKIIFEKSDFIFGLSKQSAAEISRVIKNRKKVGDFIYWIDLEKFKKIKSVKKPLNLNKKFIVLFVGRLIEEKGIMELLNSAKVWNKNISLLIAGGGPLEEFVKKNAKKNQNIIFLGKTDQKDLPSYYSMADLLIVPSVHEEGFGRVILESLACGTPVIGSNRGAIPEAMDNTVGKLIDITPQNIAEMVELFYKKPNLRKQLANNTRQFAEKRYSEKNVEKITKQYK